MNLASTAESCQLCRQVRRETCPVKLEIRKSVKRWRDVAAVMPGKSDDRRCTPGKWRLQLLS